MNEMWKSVSMGDKLTPLGINLINSDWWLSLYYFPASANSLQIYFVLW